MCGYSGFVIEDEISRCGAMDNTAFDTHTIFNFRSYACLDPMTSLVSRGTVPPAGRKFSSAEDVQIKLLRGGASGLNFTFNDSS